MLKNCSQNTSLVACFDQKAHSMYFYTNGLAFYLFNKKLFNRLKSFLWSNKKYWVFITRPCCCSSKISNKKLNFLPRNVKVHYCNKKMLYLDPLQKHFCAHQKHCASKQPKTLCMEGNKTFYWMYKGLFLGYFI